MMWKEKYKIGVPVIDQQHEELFNRVSVFIQTIRQQGDWEAKLEKVKESMAFMQEYVVVHFSAEEAYQAKINYPDLENHKQVHAQFKDAVNQYVQRAETEGYHEELLKEFGGKLMAWLIMHVAATDQKLGEYAKAQGGEA